MNDDKPSKMQCGNCKYFIRHYANKNGLFKNLSVGHCVHQAYYNKRNKFFCDSHCCELWEDNSEAIVDTHRSIADALYTMARQLNEYIQSLENEKRQ